MKHIPSALNEIHQQTIRILAQAHCTHSGSSWPWLTSRHTHLPLFYWRCSYSKTMAIALDRGLARLCRHLSTSKNRNCKTERYRAVFLMTNTHTLKRSSPYAHAHLVIKIEDNSLTIIRCCENIIHTLYQYSISVILTGIHQQLV